MIEGKIKLTRYMLTSVVSVLLILVILITAPSAFAHGGKAHTNSFTALRALQKATDLYNQLVGTGKLGETWETDLTRVEVSTRHKKSGGMEYMVSFQRNKGEPNTVYIFFTANGEYAGSNFSGN